MSFVHRFLILLVLLLACSASVVLIGHVMLLPPPDSSPVLWRTASSEETGEGPVRTFGSWLLSRLPLLPARPAYHPLLAIVVENHEDARPFHAGLDRALFIEEFFVEGMISRFVALFDAEQLPALVGPVRSLRSYFIDGVYPWSSVILHAGGSPEALDRVRDSSVLTAFNGLAYNDHFERDADIPAPHDLFITAEHVRDLFETIPEERATLWPPYPIGRAPTSSGAIVVSIDFHNPVHNVRYSYDALHHSYERLNGSLISDAHPSNILILAIPITGIGEQGRLSLGMIGNGNALLFRSGRVYTGRWRKEAEDAAFIFEDLEGQPFVFGAGQTWMTVVDSLRRVTWE